jgi:hypothetical protein
VPVRPVERFISAWDGLAHEAGERDLNLVVVGVEVAAIELCLSMQHRVQRRIPHNRIKFGVVTLHRISSQITVQACAGA